MLDYHTLTTLPKCGLEVALQVPFGAWHSTSDWTLLLVKASIWWRRKGEVFNNLCFKNRGSNTIQPRHLRQSCWFLLPAVGFILCICSVYTLLTVCVFLVCDSALSFGFDHCTYLIYTVLHLHLSSLRIMTTSGKRFMADFASELWEKNVYYGNSNVLHLLKILKVRIFKCSCSNE